MSLTELETKVQNLSPEELHAFTQWLAKYTASLPTDEARDRAIDEGVRRMEAIIQGQTAGLTESQFRAALG